MYYFNIGSPEAFEKSLYMAQRDLDIPSEKYINVTYKEKKEL